MSIVSDHVNEILQVVHRYRTALQRLNDAIGEYDKRKAALDEAVAERDEARGAQYRALDEITNTLRIMNLPPATPSFEP